MCSLCSRLRRGILYRVADELGATKIALGHHRDDMLQTFFLNMFFGGKLKGMPPKLVSDDGRHMVIRPLAYVAEKDLIRWAEHRQFPIIPCTLCGSQENLQRKQVSAMLREWEKKYPGRMENMFNALQNVVPSHLMDGALYDFKGLKATGVPARTATRPLTKKVPLNDTGRWQAERLARALAGARGHPGDLHQRPAARLGDRPRRQPSPPARRWSPKKGLREARLRCVPGQDLHRDRGLAARGGPTLAHARPVLGAPRRRVAHRHAPARDRDAAHAGVAPQWANRS
jgi:hypothetical protein